MRIYIIGPAHPYRGGIAALNERLARQLTEEGHSVDIISFRLQYPGFLFPGKSQYTDGPVPEKLTIRNMINSINPLNWIASGFRLKKEKPDLIIVRYWLPFMAPSTGTICRIVRSNRITKIIALVDNILPHEHHPGDRLFTRYFTSSVHGFIAMSKNVFTDLPLFITNHQPRLLTPHPVYDHYGKIIPKEEAKWLLNLEPDKKYLLFFGFIRDYKGLDLILEAMPEILKNVPDARLLVAGEFYSNEKKYLALIEKYQLQKTVTLHTDFIPEEEVNRYFCAADLVTQPYKSATQSGVTQIGYHFHKPMLVTDVGGLPEIIDHERCGYVVRPEPSAIAAAVTDFFINNREQEMSRAVSEKKKQFGWDKLTQTVFEIYQKSLANNLK